MKQTKFINLEKPGLVQTIAVLTLINGIVNIFWGLIATITVTASVILICLVPLTILPSILGVFEIIYAAKLLAEPPQPLQPSQTIAILEILCVLTGNVFSMVVGILSLVFYNDIQVKEYFARLNGMVTPVSPTPVPQPAPGPSIEPTKTPGTAPEPKPKAPRGRKVAEAKPSSKASEKRPNGAVKQVKKASPAKKSPPKTKQSTKSGDSSS